MFIEAFVMCDAATEQAGKLNILGAFDTITSTQLPAITHQSCLCIRMRFKKEEEGKHLIEFSIISPKDKKILESNGDINVKLNRGLFSGIVNLILNMRELTFEEFGIHNVSLKIDNREMANLLLYVNKLEEA
jgi:hypothetical protein